MKNKLTVTVGTAAYNEEQSIRKTLESVLKQKERGFEIKEILVISDGSTDNTVETVKNIKDSRIVVIHHKTRLGQPARIQELLHRFKGDYFVLLDSDVVLEDEYVIQKLVDKAASGKRIGLVAAHMRPMKAVTFLESAINNYRYAREELENEFSFGKRVWSTHGCFVYSRKFAKSLKIPKNILSVDNFSYYSCVAQGFRHEYANDAVVLYRSPQSAQDQINQATRHYTGGLQLYRYFDREMIEKEKYIPLSINLKLMFYQLLKNPLGYLELKLINTYCSYKSKHAVRNASSKWHTVVSTKQI